MYFRKLLILLLLLSTGVLYSQEIPPDMDKILKRKKIIIAMTATDHPPFHWKDKHGKMRGLDVELANGIAEELSKKLGEKVVVEFNRDATSFNGVVDIVATGKADIAISKLSKTLTRETKVIYSDPYITLRKCILINRLKMAQEKKWRTSAEFIKSMDGSIGFIKGSSYEGYAEQMFPKAKHVPFVTWEEAVEAIKKGEVTAIFRDELEIKKLTKMNPNISIQLQSVIFKDTADPIAIATNWKNTHLQYWLNSYLQSRHLKMDADKLLDKYPGCFKNEHTK
jgi:polar amino acid transport system substrate-binding protein